MGQAQDQATSANTVVNAATADQNKAQGNVDSAAKDVASQTDKLNNMTADKLNADKNKTTQSIEDNQAKVQTTTDQLNSAKQNVTDATTEVAQATTNAQNAADKSSQAQTDLANAKTANTAAQQAKSNAQSKVDQLADQLAAMPNLTINVNDWKKLVNDQAAISSLPADQQAAAKQAFQDEYNKFVAQVDAANVYTPSAADQKIKLADYSDLTQDQRDELMNFALDLINQSVTLWQGTKANNFQSTREDMTISQGLADDYSAANVNMDGDHLIGKIGAILTKYQFDRVSENWGGTLLSYMKNAGALTLGEMKRAIYQDIVGMMFEDADSNFGHMKNWTNNSGTGYVGIGFDKYGNTHYLIHTPFKSGVAANTAPIKQFAQTLDVQASLASAKSDLTAKSAAADTATSKLNDASAAATKAATANSQAQSALKAAKDNLANKTNRVNSLSEELAATKASLANDEAHLATVNAELANLSEARSKQQSVIDAAKLVETKAQQALNDAKATTAKAQNGLKAAQANLDAKQTSLDAAKRGLKDAQANVAAKEAALTQAKKTVADMKNAGNVLSAAEQALEAAKANLADKTAAYDQAVVANNEAKANLSVAMTTKSEADKTYQRAQQLVNTLKAKAALEAQLAKEAADKQANNSKTDVKKQLTEQGKTVDALKDYADQLAQAAFLAQLQAIASGNDADQVLADQLQAEADQAQQQYQRALAEFNKAKEEAKSSRVNVAGDAVSETSVDKLNGATQKGPKQVVEMLDSRTGVVMPTMNKKQAKATLKSSQHVNTMTLPQTNETNDAKIGVVTGALSLMTVLSLFGLKRKRTN